MSESRSQRLHRKTAANQGLPLGKALIIVADG